MIGSKKDKMSRQKERFYAVANGSYLALGHPGQFGFRNGCLTRKVKTLEEAEIYSGFRGKKKLNRMVDQMLEARQSLVGSVIYDWPAVKELTGLGVISVCQIPNPPKRKRNPNPRPKLKLEA